MLPPDSTSPRGPQYARITALIEGFDAAMFTCTGINGAPCARPLLMKRDPNNQLLYFPTSQSAPLLADLERDSRAHVTMQGRHVFISLVGRAMATSDRAIIERCWAEGWRPWFPDGLDDPHLRLVCFAPHTGEYWDDDNARGLTQLVQSAKVLLTGGDLPLHSVDHAKVSLAYWYTS